MRSRAYEQGYQSYFDGMDLGDNPFTEDTDDYYEWERGWYDAEDNEENDD